MIANKEKCADKDSGVCDYNEYQRLRYFHGMLLDDKDFQAEQAYHTRKRRFLNRMLHGWGVVCGLELKGNKGDRSIDVTSGMALDCCGNEIWVPHTKPIDLMSLLPCDDKGKKEGECLEDVVGNSKSYYIGVRYYEKPSNPVSVYLPSGGCEERTCENSRIKEGYCIELVPCNEKANPELYPGLIKDLCGCTPDFQKPKDKEPVCPDYSGNDPKELCQQLKMAEFCEQSVPCPECCSADKPCFVVLGEITVNKECRLDSICMNHCRRYVLTPRLLQHILLSVFTGALGEEGYIKMVGEDKKPFALPDVQEWVYNPIKLVCSWLPNMVNDRTIQWLGCDKKVDVVDPQEFAQMKKELRDLKVLLPAKPAPGPADPLIVIPPEVGAAGKAETEKGKKEKGSKPEQ
ncbi:MAG TPA: hypothetical protein VKB05_21340 [Pyrinomonadaceae bacterium]|nr:hypothetical protein [Pyrinomonadaceae bacterium]